MILARFTWPNAQRTIKEWCHNCLTCQQMKITRHIHPPTRQLNEAVARFTHVHMDIVGPLPAINNSPFRYLVTFIDRSTNWIEAHPVHSTSTAEEVCHAFSRPGFLASEYHCTSRLTVEPNLKVNYSHNFPKL